jgi:pyrroline-5-carboxylate reductase
VNNPDLIPPILLVGCGKMGSALLAGWQEQGLSPSVVVEPQAASLTSVAEVSIVAAVSDIPEGFVPQAVILAVKPQMATAILPMYRRFATSAVFLSIMAGRTVEGMRSLLGAGASVVRAMPNTPAAVRQGVTVATAGPGVTPVQSSLCNRLLQAIGTVAWVDQEGLLDAVTAVSGGGPAYVFLLAELLETAGIEQGLPPELARAVARQTISGSGALLRASQDDAAVLRRAVTSPNGTTERALAVLMASDAWPSSISRAIEAATVRSRDLAD